MGAYAPPGGGPPPRRRPRGLAIIAIVIVVILIGSVIAVEALYSPSSAVQVNFINIWAPNNVCGLNSNPIGYTGYSGSTGSVILLELDVPNYNTTTCTIHTVVTNSTGFTLSGVQVPLSIAGNGDASMNLTVTSPGGSFSGNLNLVFA